MVFSDFWADTTKPGVTARPSIALKYTGNAVPADDLVTPAPVNGLVNYPTHVAPLWTRNRGANTCTGCHNDNVKLDLTRDDRGHRPDRSRTRSSCSAIRSSIRSRGLPVTRIREGVLEIVRGPALVDTMASEGDALGLARKSRLYEIMSGRTLLAGADARAAHPNPPVDARRTTRRCSTQRSVACSSS